MPDDPTRHDSTHDDPTVTTLRRAMGAATREHHLALHVAEVAWTDARTARGHRTRTVGAVAAATVAVGGLAAGLALTRGDGTSATSSSSACARSVSTAVLPPWARGGFGPDALHPPHVIGEGGQIVGILFGTLRAHQPAGVHNKILWAAREGGGGDLHVRARLEGTGTTAARTVHLGPSTLDLPASGCWQLTLTWSGHRSAVAIRYR